MKKVFRDSVHGDIFIDNPMYVEIINTPEMQRLRRIFQLAGSQYAFSSATHTRFMHCLGVLEVINKFTKNSEFKQLSEYEKDLLKLTGLLHDVGHGPFSHTFEKITFKSHEEYSADIILNEQGNIYPILVKYKINPSEIVDILKSKHKNTYLNTLVSSQLDADRIDYLKRDSYYCGVNYASLDTDFLIRNAKLIDGKIVYPIKTLYAIESYLLGRYYMYKQVYEHKDSIAFDKHFQILFKRLKDLNDEKYDFLDKRVQKYFSYIFDGKNIPLDLYLELDDMTLIDIFKNLTRENDKIIADLADRMINRRFFQYKSSNDLTVGEIKTKLKQQGYDLRYYFIDVEPRKVNIYREGTVDGKNQNIYILTQNQSVKKFSHVTFLTNTIKDLEDEKISKKYLFPKELV